MGERQLLAVGRALILALAPLFVSMGPVVGQGPVYRERWGHLFLERRRAEVWQALEGRDAATRTKVAALLAEPASAGLPFAAPAKALALLRGVEMDAAFELRATMGVFTLPEVCDPEGRNEVCHNLNASVFLPFSLPEPAPLSFEVTVHDAAGAVKFTTVLSESTTIADLRMARVAVSVPCEGLADGAYQLDVRTLIGGVGPRSTDPTLQVRFQVLRGYQQRSEAAMAKVRSVAPQLPAMSRALLEGFSAEVSRAYVGEAFDVESDAKADLERLEAGLQNLGEERHVLHGFSGDVPTAVPTGAGSMSCVLRLGEGRNPSAKPAPRTLVIVAGGSPAYDTTAWRPTAPASRGPRWLAAELPRFGQGQPFDVAFLESPGGGRNYADDLPQAIASLCQLWSVGEQPVVLVCEREAAVVIALQLAKVKDRLRGLVLVGGGGMPGQRLDELGPLSVRVGLLQGFPSSEALRRSLDYVAQRRAEKTWSGDYSVLSEDQPAWLFGLREFAPAIAKFAAGLAGG